MSIKRLALRFGFAMWNALESGKQRAYVRSDNMPGERDMFDSMPFRAQVQPRSMLSYLWWVDDRGTCVPLGKPGFATVNQFVRQGFLANPPPSALPGWHGTLLVAVPSNRGH